MSAVVVYTVLGLRGVRPSESGVALVQEVAGVAPWRWDAASTATDDGVSVVAVPGIPVGRWLRSSTPATSAEVAGATVQLLSVDLDTMVGVVGRVYRTAGRSSVGPGWGQFRWVPIADASGIVRDGGRVWGTTGQGFFVSTLGRRFIRAAEYFDLSPNGTSFSSVPDSTTAVQAMFAAGQIDKTEFRFDEGVLRTAAQDIRPPRGTRLHGLSHDGVAGGGGFQNRTQWVIDITDPLVTGAPYGNGILLGGQIKIAGFSFFPGPNRSIRSCFRYNNHAEGVATGTEISVCGVYGRYAAGQGDFAHAFIAGEGDAGNCDEFLMRGCYLHQIGDCCIVLAGAQPLGMKFRDNNFAGGARAEYEGYGLNTGLNQENGGCWGSVIRFLTVSADATFDGGTFSYMERGVEIVRTGAPTNYGGSPSFVTLKDVTSEGVKKLLWTNAVYNNGRSAIVILGGRHDLWSSKRSLNHLASDNEVITFEHGGSFTNFGVIESIPVSGTGYIRVAQTTHVDGNGDWPSERFLRRTISNASMDRGGCYARGFATAPGGAADGFSNVRRIVRYNGVDEPSGDRVVRGSATTLRVQFSNPLKENYHLSVGQPVVFSGSPSAGALQPLLLTERDAEGFTLMLGAAAGTPLDSVRVFYDIFPGAVAGADGAVPAYETITNSDTFRATANPGGVTGHATNGLHVAALVYTPSGTRSGGQWIARRPGEWGLYVDFNDNGVVFQAGTATSAKWTPTGGDLDKAHVIVGTWDPTNGPLLYVDGLLIEGAAVAGSYAPASARTEVGPLQYSSPDVRVGVFSVSGGAAVATSDEVRALHAATKASGQLVPVPAKTSHHWLMDGSATVVPLVGTGNITTVSGASLAVTAIVPAIA